jgi:hypothetical protein
MVKLSFKTEVIKEDSQSKKVRITLNLKDQRFEISVNLGEYTQYDELMAEIKDLKSNLDGILDLARPLFEEKKEEVDMSPQGLWEKICSMKDQEAVRFFNSLPILKRMELSDYIFSHCNVFSGKGKLFSERYDQENSLLT